MLDEPLSGMDPLARRKTIRLLRNWAAAGRNVIVSSHILHEVEALTSDILLMHHGRVLAEGNVHQIRDLIDEHPHTVCLRSKHPRALATTLVANEDVLSVRFEEDAVFVQTAKPESSMRASPRWRPITAQAISTRSRRPTTTCRPSSSIW